MSDDSDRYARHHLIDWWDQDRLKAARVMVAGAGAIGNEVIKLLALLGVGQILIVDYDRIDLSNLTRSVLFRESDVGRSKALTAAERAREIDPGIEVRAIDGDLEFDVGLGVYAGVDLVIGCLDSLNARLVVNRSCRRVGTPWLNGGIEATLAEVALYGAEGPCYACAMSAEMWDRRNRRYSCTGLRADIPENKMPTTATVASIAAGYLVNEALLLLHAGRETDHTQHPTPEHLNTEHQTPGPPNHFGDTEHPPKEGLNHGQKLYLTFKPYGFYVIDLPYDPDCLAHERYAPVERLAFRPSELTVMELLRHVGLLEGIVELGYDLLTAMRCVQCGRSEAVLRPLERCPETIHRCPDCDALTRQPDTVSWVDAGSELARCTLAQLGVPDHQILVVKGLESTHYFQLSGEALWTAAG